MKIRFSSDPLVAHETNGLAVSYAPSKRKIASWRWRVLVVLVLSPLLIFLTQLLYDAIWASMPGFVVMEETVFKAPLSGKLVMTVPVGHSVRPGDAIAELRNDVLEKEYAALLASRSETRGSPSYAHAEDDARATAAAQDVARVRREQYEKLSELADQNAATQAEVAAAFASLNAAEQELRTARQRRTSGMRTVAETVANEPRLSEMRAMLDAMTIKTSEAGIVSQVMGKPGEWVTAGAELADLQLNRPEKIEVFVEPSWARHATVGSWATVNFLDGYSHRARVREVKMHAQRLPPDRANPLTVRHHSIVVLLEPVPRLPKQYQVNVLPVNVQFDREFGINKLAFWKTNDQLTAAK